MDEICTGLFVGTIADAGDESLLEGHAVDRVVSLTHTDPETGFPATVSVVEAPMKDGPRNERARFESAVEATLAGLRSGENVLVHCSRGASRSPSVAATAIAVSRDVGIQAAFEQVAASRAECDPHPALVRRAVSVFRDLQQ
jgi:predicted protein tyrosine phosphatase